MVLQFYNEKSGHYYKSSKDRCTYQFFSEDGYVIMYVEIASAIVLSPKDMIKLLIKGMLQITSVTYANI